MIAGNLNATVSSPPSTSRVTSALSPLIVILEAKVACGQPKSAASICPVWLQSSSIACLPMMTISGLSLSMTAFNSLATARGCSSTSVNTRTPRSAPIAKAVRIVSWHCWIPAETMITSSTMPASLRRSASSTAISSNGFIDILTFAVSTPEPSALTRTFTLKSTTRLTGTRIFIHRLLLKTPADYKPWRLPPRLPALTDIIRRSPTAPAMPRPLSHIRVLDLSRVLAGPWASQNLADLGAEVIKIERPGSGDDTRSWGPPFLKDKYGRDTRESAYFLSVNRGKKSVTLDIARPEGQRIARELAAKSDVIIENYKVGGLAKYGLAYEDLKKIHPKIVYCSVTGF